MPSLVVPESGFDLESSLGRSASKAGSLVPDVLGLTLTDGMIEEMIKCFQNGKPIQLSLGESPTFSYGNKTQLLAPSNNQITYDLYQHSNLTDSDSSDEDDMPSHFIQRKPKLVSSIKSSHQFAPTTAAAEAAKRLEKEDPAVAALQAGLADLKSKKDDNTIVFVKDGTLPIPGRKAASAKAANHRPKFLSQNRLGSETARSIPSSPLINASNSPSLGATSVPASAQQSEQAKAARKPIIHVLAVRAMTEKALLKKLPEYTETELKNILNKVGDEVDGKWELRRNAFKELDIWSFEYEPSSDRDLAFENARKVYDRLRLADSEPQWERLHPPTKRGKGIILSNLQHAIARGTAGRAPAVKISKPDGSDTPIEEGSDETKAKTTEGSRSSSQAAATKAKKPSDSQPKKSTATKPNKTISKPVSKPIAKPAATKKSAPQPKTSSKALSSEFVEESDEDLSPPQAPPPKVKAPAKRQREEELESSDSSAPLSKKVKKSAPIITGHRISDASQASRATNSSISSYTSSHNSSRNKNTSPQKSSPLASSPPTNASEIENSAGDRTSSSASPAHPSTKNSRSPIHKRHQKSSSVTSSTSSSSSTRQLSPKVMDIARKFRVYYPKYEALHKKLAAMAPKRDLEEEKHLLDMRDRLEDMKKRIQDAMMNDDSQSS